MKFNSYSYLSKQQQKIIKDFAKYSIFTSDDLAAAFMNLNYSYDKLRIAMKISNQFQLSLSEVADSITRAYSNY